MSYFVAPLRAKLRHATCARRRQRGLSLVELMIAITLGMVAVAGAISIYLANRSSYKLVEGAARVQENARFAMEFMGRDLREAGGIVCGGNLVQENVLTSSQKAEWWSDWSTGLKGYGSSPNNAAEMPTNALAKFGAAVDSRKTGTDAVIIWSASTASPSVLTQDSSGTNFTVYPAQTASTGSVLTAWDDARVSTFSINQAATTTVTAAQTPTTSIKKGGVVNKLNASAWYICVRQNAPSLYSLCREGLGGGVLGPVSSAQEILENVTNMQITYLLGDGNGTPTASAYADGPTYNTWTSADWAKVQAVRVVLTLATPDNVATSSGASTPLSQNFAFTVALRRRLP
jgi:type IV pilus assembly protein PilW